MTNQDAIQNIRELFYWYLEEANHNPIDCADKLESINMAIAELEKQIPMKPVHIPDDDECIYYHYECPSCGERLGFIWKNYRCKCGQMIDWSDK